MKLLDKIFGLFNTSESEKRLIEFEENRKEERKKLFLRLNLDKSGIYSFEEIFNKVLDKIEEKNV